MDEHQRIWPTAVSSLALFIAVTLGWILTFYSGLLTSLLKPDQPMPAKSRTP